MNGYSHIAFFSFSFFVFLFSSEKVEVIDYERSYLDVTITKYDILITNVRKIQMKIA